jgi:hypothetical protein
MIDAELDPIIERIAREARRPAAVDPDARARLVAAIRAEGAPGSYDPENIFTVIPQRGLRLSLTTLGAMAAGLVGIGVLVGMALQSGRDSQVTGQPQVVVANDPPSRLPVSNAPDTVLTFVFVAQGATRVSLVGDFNQWDADATPMRRIENSNAWAVTVPLSRGRHVYQFYAVDSEGEKWIADPSAPAVPDGGFGRANSVVLVGSASLQRHSC